MELYSNKAGDDYYNEGSMLQDEGKNMEALLKYRKAAEDFNHSGAQFAISLMYYNGYGVPIDYTKAMLWSKRAANAGHILAHSLIGMMHKSGEGVSVNHKEAARWFEISANQGDYHAESVMGFMYVRGEGVPIDNKKALYWLQKAVNNDNTPAYNTNAKAKYFIGLAYKNGVGVAKNDEISLRCFIESAEGGSIEAKSYLGILYMNGFGVVQDYAKALYWFTTAASGGDDEAKICLGCMYENGLGVMLDNWKAKEYFDLRFKDGIEIAMCGVGENYLGVFSGIIDSEKALYWFERAARSNNVRALLSIGAMYMTGVADGRKDMEKAYSYLSHAAYLTQVPLTFDQLKTQNNSDTEGEPGNAIKWYIKLLDDGKTVGKGYISGFFSCLGLLYHIGLGVPQDFTLAHEIYKNTLLLFGDNDTDVNVYMGLLYSKGLGVEQDLELAMAYFERSAKHINTYTYNLIGDAYKFGRGVEKDYAMAMEWYMKGVRYQDEYSELNVGKMYLTGIGVAADNTIALSWFQKAYSHGCREARYYLPHLQDSGKLIKSDQPTAYQLLAEERTARETAEIELSRLKDELARIRQTSTENNSVNQEKKVKKPLQFFYLDDSSAIEKSASEISDISVTVSSLSITPSTPQLNVFSESSPIKNNAKKPLQFFHL